MRLAVSSSIPASHSASPKRASEKGRRVNSPLGQYGPLVASVTALAVIGAFILAVFVRTALGMIDADINSLRELALLALGAVFGAASAVASNRSEIAAANKRLDALGAPPATNANGGG